MSTVLNALASADSVLYLVVLATGIIAGVINTLAGGGSNLTVPALMMFGLPADAANATNRVGVFLQCLVGIRGFSQAGKLALNDVRPILGWTMAGGLIGALSASFMPNIVLKPLMLFAMISMAALVLLRPTTLAPKPDEPARAVAEQPWAWLYLLLTGVYGGFVQAGVGFLLLGSLSGALRYDLWRANALKLLCTMMFTAVALVVFVSRDQVVWVPALVLALGTMLGARLAVSWSLHISQRTLKWFVLWMTVAASVAAMLR
nr:sulfite exporter TauE/SafE family protein [Oceanococcus sp. HetDA_MAG_MS8]